MCPKQPTCSDFGSYFGWRHGWSLYCSSIKTKKKNYFKTNHWFLLNNTLNTLVIVPYHLHRQKQLAPKRRLQTKQQSISFLFCVSFKYAMCVKRKRTNNWFWATNVNCLNTGNFRLTTICQVLSAQCSAQTNQPQTQK